MGDFKLVKLIGNPVQLTFTGGINPTGAYDALTAYSTGDSVSYNGSSYVAIQATTGNLPTDTAFWQLLAAGSNDMVTITDDGTYYVFEYGAVKLMKIRKSDSQLFLAAGVNTDETL